MEPCNCRALKRQAEHHAKANACTSATCAMYKICWFFRTRRWTWLLQQQRSGLCQQILERSGLDLTHFPFQFNCHVARPLVISSVPGQSISWVHLGADADVKATPQMRAALLSMNKRTSRRATQSLRNRTAMQGASVSAGYICALRSTKKASSRAAMQRHRVFAVPGARPGCARVEQDGRSHRRHGSDGDGRGPPAGGENEARQILRSLHCFRVHRTVGVWEPRPTRPKLYQPANPH